ncbi:wall-associated receptor kinase-like 10 [Primulina tabacum]|uniref:wall-associated receptor kinase-like 10 n=1 Tax=Primulina tabacum TaxID=48773 RepID=UPI003F5A4302
MGLTLIARIAVSICLSMTVALAVSLSKPNCTNTCGNVTIPYPFGIGARCSASSWFTVACQNSSFPPKLSLSSINMEIENISLDNGTVRVIEPVSPLNCSDEQRLFSLGRSLTGSAFTISAFQNSFALLGCDNSIWLRANNETIGGCMAVCDPSSNDTSCNGINCCQITIPTGLQELQYSYNRTLGSSTNGNSCGYAFLTERKWFQEDYKTYRGLHTNLSNPFDEGFRYANMVLEWEVDNMTRSNYSSCIYLNGTRSTQLCSCNRGFEGNPYLPGGCQDINECERLNFCTGTCINTLGSYRCQAPTKRLASYIGIVSALGSLLLLIAAMWCYRVIRKRLKANRKKRFFTRNGGILLEKQLHSTDNGVEKTKLFDAKELAQATDQYNENRVLGRGGQGTVYKGMLKDGRVVAVKKSKKVDKDDIELFINEVVILSQINHRHVVKLLGCCLETEVPLLVYEFIPNGTLFEHIHDPKEEFPLTWEMRIRIATEVASAISYLHSAASTPIYHRDIKSTNILLDSKYQAKVADFGTSRTISIDQTHVTTRVLGTFGYLDPEYFQSGQFTDKSDVYSFGVVIVELLTGEKAISSIRAEEGRSLITYFLHSVEENQLFDIIDSRVLKEGQKEEIVAIAQLAKRCLYLKGKKRPTMREVAAELEGIQIRKQGSGFQHSYDETEYHSIDLYDAYDISSNSSSMQFDTNPTCAADVRPLLK